MAQDITATMDGTLLNWLKSVGESVSSGDVIAEMDADKATVEIEAPGDGVLIAQSAQPGDEVSEGAVIGQLGAAGEAAQNGGQSAPAPVQQAEAASNGKAAEQPAAVAEAHSNGAQTAATTPEGRIRISPIARRMAEAQGIDLQAVQGSGPGGRIVKADIENYTPAPAKAASAAPLPAPQHTPPAESPDVEYLDISTMRRRIAAGTVESQQNVPHFYVTMDIDVTALMAMRKAVNASLDEGDTRVSVNDLLVKATALTLRDFPNLNSHYYGDKIAHFKHINIGIAVAPPEGGVIYIVAPDADKTSLGTLAAENKAKAVRAREGKIKPADVQGVTFSTSNLGAWGVEHFAAIINPPEAGVLAFGAARKEPVVKEDGTLGVGERMRATISVDHRISDGAEGADFLKAFKTLLENPMRLLL